MTVFHGSCVALDERGVLIRGASGSGKSDLALRLIDDGAALVADDYVEIRVENGRVIARAPAPLEGLLEVRGLGLMRLPYRLEASIALTVDLVARERVERMPEARRVEVAGTELPSIRLWAFGASTAAKIRLAMHRIVAAGAEPVPHGGAGT